MLSQIHVWIFPPICVCCCIVKFSNAFAAWFASMYECKIVCCSSFRRWSCISFIMFWMIQGVYLFLFFKRCSSVVESALNWIFFHPCATAFLVANKKAHVSATRVVVIPMGAAITITTKPYEFLHIHPAPATSGSPPGWPLLALSVLIYSQCWGGGIHFTQTILLGWDGLLVGCWFPYVCVLNLCLMAQLYSWLRNNAIWKICCGVRILLLCSCISSEPYVHSVKQHMVNASLLSAKFINS